MAKEIIVGRHNQKPVTTSKALVLNEMIKEASTEKLLKELKDRGVIRSWYYNGSYHIGNDMPHKE